MHLAARGDESNARLAPQPRQLTHLQGGILQVGKGQSWAGQPAIAHSRAQISCPPSPLPPFSPSSLPTSTKVCVPPLRP